MGAHQDPRHAGKHPELKAKAIVPDVLLMPHNASLEFLFYDGKQFPAEYRGDLHFDFHPDWESQDDAGIRARDESAPRARARHFHRDGTWVVFADAGRGWLVGAPDGRLTYASGRIPSFSTFRSDIGAGLDFGGVGFYMAKAMSSSEEPLRLFVRLRHRF